MHGLVSNGWRTNQIMSTIRIPFNQPTNVGGEAAALAEAIRQGHLCGLGPATRQCQQILEKEIGVKKALLTTSCTDALEMTALLLKLQPGDEVILPSFTFVSTANAYAVHGARPVFADIRPDTLNLNEGQLERHITSRTRAIVVVHYAGVACEMDAILAIADRRGIPVIEDNAHGLFGRYKGRQLGSIGALATQSFHDTKNFTCGEGGALLVNHPQYLERAEILLEKGTDRSRFLRGQVDKYTWVDLGSSYLSSDLLAAFLHVQLQARAQIQARRKEIWDTYHQQLHDWARRNQVGLPSVPAYCEQAYHVYYMILPTMHIRQALISHLRERGIQSVFHYVPLHLSRMGQHFGGKPGDCPVTEDISDRLLRLPLFTSLTQDEQAEVIAAVRDFHIPAAHANGVEKTSQSRRPLSSS